MARSSGLSLVMHNKRDDHRPPEERQCDLLADFSYIVKRKWERERKRERYIYPRFPSYVRYFAIDISPVSHFHLWPHLRIVSISETQYRA